MVCILGPGTCPYYYLPISAAAAVRLYEGATYLPHHNGSKAISKSHFTRLKRFMSVFCKRRGADDFFLMVDLPAVSVFTFNLFWVKAPLHTGLN